MFNMSNLKKFEDLIKINFNQKNLLIEALSHSSYSNENPVFKNQYGLTDGNNERLEYLGDSVLGLAIAEKLYCNHPGSEGDLTKIKTHFVRGNKVAEISDKIGLENFLIMGKGEINNESGRESRIADSLEALIAAIFIDQGYDRAKEFINKYFLSDLDNILENVEKIKIEENPIGYLQELLVKADYDNPIYDCSRLGGPDNSPIFLAELKINNKKIAEGTGVNKQKAREDAARNALENIDSII